MSGHFDNHDVFDILRGKSASQLIVENSTIADYADYMDEDVSESEDPDGSDVMPSVRFYGVNF